MRWDLADQDEAVIYKLLAATVIPRPIAWVVTMDRAGRHNAAPFSFFNVMGTQPPILALGIQSDEGRPDGTKDSARNIIETGAFSVNLVPESLAEAMNVTAVNAPPGVDELQLAGLVAAPCQHIAPPRIAQSPVAFECVLHASVVTGPAQHLVIGRVLAVHVAKEFVLDQEAARLDTPAMQLLGRGFAQDYIRTGDRFQMARPSWQDWLASGKVRP